MSDRSCIVIGNREHLKLLEPIVGRQFSNFSFHLPHFDPIPLLSSKRVSCIVMFITSLHDEMLRKSIMKCKYNHSAIPIVGIIDDLDVEAVRIYGRIGIDCVIHSSMLETLNEVLERVLGETNSRVRIGDIFNEDAKSSKLVSQALEYMEKNYLSIMSMFEISESLGVSECTLSREFKKNSLPGPKRILMEFKIRHALNLMKNSNLGLKAIAILSGFSNEKRFNECFHRFFQIGPRDYDLGATVGQGLP